MNNQKHKCAVFYDSRNGWWYHIKDSTPMGPFSTRDAAESFMRDEFDMAIEDIEDIEHYDGLDYAAEFAYSAIRLITTAAVIGGYLAAALWVLGKIFAGD